MKNKLIAAIMCFVASLSMAAPKRAFEDEITLRGKRAVELGHDEKRRCPYGYALTPLQIESAQAFWASMVKGVPKGPAYDALLGALIPHAAADREAFQAFEASIAKHVHTLQPQAWPTPRSSQPAFSFDDLEEALSACAHADPEHEEEAAPCSTPVATPYTLGQVSLIRALLKIQPADREAFQGFVRALEALSPKPLAQENYVDWVCAAVSVPPEGRESFQVLAKNLRREAFTPSTWVEILEGISRLEVSQHGVFESVLRCILGGYIFKNVWDENALGYLVEVLCKERPLWSFIAPELSSGFLTFPLDINHRAALLGFWSGLPQPMRAGAMDFARDMFAKYGFLEGDDPLEADDLWDLLACLCHLRPEHRAAFSTATERLREVPISILAKADIMRDLQLVDLDDWEGYMTFVQLVLLHDGDCEDACEEFEASLLLDTWSRWKVAGCKKAFLGEIPGLAARTDARDRLDLIQKVVAEAGKSGVVQPKDAL